MQQQYLTVAQLQLSIYGDCGQINGVSECFGASHNPAEHLLCLSYMDRFNVLFVQRCYSNLIFVCLGSFPSVYYVLLLLVMSCICTGRSCLAPGGQRSGQMPAAWLRQSVFGCAKCTLQPRNGQRRLVCTSPGGTPSWRHTSKYETWSSRTAA